MSAVIARSVKATAWPEVSLNELVGKNGLFCDGDWVESKDQDPNGDVRLIQLADIGDGSYRNRSSRFLTSSKAEELRCTLLKQGDVLVARMPEPLGRACIFPGDEKPAVTVVDVAIIRPSSKDVDSRWLMHALNSPETRAEIAGLEAGTTRKRISRKNLATITLRLPPLDEQRRIVAEIEEQLSRLEAGVAALKRVQANLKRYRASVLDDFVQTTTGLSAGATRTCADACDFITKGTTPSPIKLLAGSGDVQFLKVYNLTFEGRLNAAHKPAFVSRETHDKELSRSKVRSGDVLMNIVGPPLGQVSIVPDSLPEANINQAIARFRAREIVLPRFLMFWLLAPSTVRWTISRSKATAGQFNLTLETCRNIPIQVPPIEKQHRLVTEVDRRFSVVEELETQVSIDLVRAERLRQAILSSAFSSRSEH